MYYRIIFYMCEYCKSLPKANLGLCYRGFQIFFFRPAADLPTQPLVQHSIAETPLVRAWEEIEEPWNSINFPSHLQISRTITGPKDDSLTFTRQALDFTGLFIFTECDSPAEILVSAAGQNSRDSLFFSAGRADFWKNLWDTHRN